MIVRNVHSQLQADMVTKLKTLSFKILINFESCYLLSLGSQSPSFKVVEVVSQSPSFKVVEVVL